MSGRQREPGYAGTYRRTGPRTQVCIDCNTCISTNAIARGNHETGKRHRAAIDAKRQHKEREPS